MKKTQIKSDKLKEQKERTEGHQNSYINENKNLRASLAKSEKLSKAYKGHIQEIQKVFAKIPKLQDDIYLFKKADPDSKTKQLWKDARDKNKWGKDFNKWLLKLRSTIYGVVLEGES
jgi:Zn-dependent M32 family carboxypeptidase